MTEQPKKSQEGEQGIDMTELAKAIAKLNNQAPPSGPVIVPAWTFLTSAQIEKEKAEASAALAKEAENAEPGDQMRDGTFYLGRFTSADGTEKHWFAAAEDAKDASSVRLCLTFNGAAKFAKNSEAHGYNDWTVPFGHNDIPGEPDILGAIFNNKARIGKEEINGFDETGAFPAGWYWSSSFNPYSNDCMNAQQFSERGIQKNSAYKSDGLSLRLVRCVNV